MASTPAHFSYQNSSPRALAMFLALVSAVVLSPLYVDQRKSESRLETRWSTGGLVLPAVVVGLIVAIKTSTFNAMQRGAANNYSYPEEHNSASVMFRIGSSCWGLAGILIVLLFINSWQTSVQHFFWR